MYFCVFVCTFVHDSSAKYPTWQPPGMAQSELTACSLQPVTPQTRRRWFDDAGVDSGNCSEHLRMSLCCQLAAEFQLI